MCITDFTNVTGASRFTDINNINHLNHFNHITHNAFAILILTYCAIGAIARFKKKRKTPIGKRKNLC